MPAGLVMPSFSATALMYWRAGGNFLTSSRRYSGDLEGLVLPANAIAKLTQVRSQPVVVNRFVVGRVVLDLPHLRGFPLALDRVVGAVHDEHMVMQ